MFKVCVAMILNILWFVSIGYSCNLSDVENLPGVYEVVVPYCFIEEECRDKPELYFSDVICAMSDYYKSDIVRFIPSPSEEDLQEINKDTVIWYYGGGSQEIVTFCEYVNGECKFSREFLCLDRSLKDNSGSVCFLAEYTVNGKRIFLNEESFLEDDVLKFMWDNIPKDREKIKYFGDLEVHW